MKAQSAEFFQKGDKPMTDKEIIKQMEDSSEVGFRLLFDEYHNYVYTIVYQILRNTGSSRDIEECVSDVLTNVMMNYDTDYNGSLKAYIGTVARCRAIDMKRTLTRITSKNISMDDETVSELTSTDNVEENIENSELARIILENIEKLGSPDADILIQKYFFDRKSHEIAMILKMNPITVRSRCKRAIKRLKEVLSDLDITL